MRVEIVALITVRRKGLLFSFEIRFVDSRSGMFFFLCFVIARCHSPPLLHSLSSLHIPYKKSTLSVGPIFVLGTSYLFWPLALRAPAAEPWRVVSNPDLTMSQYRHHCIHIPKMTGVLLGEVSCWWDMTWHFLVVSITLLNIYCSNIWGDKDFF